MVRLGDPHLVTWVGQNTQILNLLTLHEAALVNDIPHGHPLARDIFLRVRIVPLLKPRVAEELTLLHPLHPFAQSAACESQGPLQELLHALDLGLVVLVVELLERKVERLVRIGRMHLARPARPASVSVLTSIP